MFGGLIGGGSGRAVAAIGGGPKTRESQRHADPGGQPLRRAGGGLEGQCLKSDFAGFGGIFGGGAGGLGGYQNTAQAKVITAAFMDAYNQMVVALRNYKAQSVLQGQNLGGGGKLGVDGGVAPRRPRPAPPCPCARPRNA